MKENMVLIVYGIYFSPVSFELILRDYHPVFNGFGSVNPHKITNRVYDYVEVLRALMSMYILFIYIYIFIVA